MEELDKYSVNIAVEFFDQSVFRTHLFCFYEFYPVYTVSSLFEGYNGGEVGMVSGGLQAVVSRFNLNIVDIAIYRKPKTVVCRDT